MELAIGLGVLVALAVGTVAIALCKTAAKADEIINRNNEGNLDG